MESKYRRFKYSVLVILIAIVYYFAAHLGLLLAFEHTNASPVWPPSGIGFAALLIFGRRFWPAITIGAFLANGVTFYTHQVAGPLTIFAISSLIATGNTLEAVLGVFLLRSFLGRRRNPFDRASGVFKFVLVTLLMCLPAASIGTTALFLFGIITKAFYGVVWLTWWWGDATGILVFTSLLIIWRYRPSLPTMKPMRFSEAVLFALVLYAVSRFIYGESPGVGHAHYPISFVLIPLIIWAAFRFHQIIGGLAILLLSGVAVWGTLNGLGPFAMESQNQSLLLLQTFITTVTLTWLFLTAILLEQREVEQKLRQSREETRLILETANDAFISMDEKGLITDWNRQAQVVFGWAREEVYGRPLAEIIIPPGYREAHRTGLKRFLATHESQLLNKRMELTALRRGGQEFPVELMVWPIYFGGSYHFNAILRDITERKHEEERLKQVVESAPNAMVMVDGTGKIVLVNQMVEKVFGYSREELYGQSVEIFVPERFRGKHEGYRTGFFKTPESRPMGAGRDLYGLCKDGTEVPVEIGLNPIQMVEGSFVLASIVNITERKKAEEKQSQLLKELEAVNRELSDFAQVVSHDLKAPLRGINTVAEWFASEYQEKLGDKGKEWLRLMNDRIRHAYALIDGILEYSSVGRLKGKLRDVDLNKLMREVITVIDPPENVAIEIEGPLPFIQCDPIRIRQVFQNLIGNAVKYIDKPGGKIQVSCIPDGFFWKFCVSDNGPGIDPKYFRKIFQMFQTLQPKDQSKNTGIGLPLAKKIVEMYGGMIWVESNRGEGSRFFFTFPRQVIAKEA